MNIEQQQDSILEMRAELLGSLIGFTKIFYKFRTGRDFLVNEPIGRESHFKSMSRQLMQVLFSDLNRLMINLPPRYGKTELLIHFVAWALAHHPDSNFIYVSYSHRLAEKQTQTIRQIVQMPLYQALFGVQIAKESRAKDNFETTAGGSVYAAGSRGTIQGRGAGIAYCERYGGSIIIDDIHKASTVLSDTIRLQELDWYLNTLQSRVNDKKTSVIYIGTRLHEDDLAGNLLKGFDTHDWTPLVLEALDSANNALCPDIHTVEQLEKMREIMPYVFWAQYQQKPTAAGGAVFKRNWFVLTEEEPEILTTFITVDSAETEDLKNDATVLSFWGLYKIKDYGVNTELYGLHWIDCVETWVEPADLETVFMEFYVNALRHKMPPKLAAIEKKSTGTTLCSTMKRRQGLQILEIERNRSSGSKAYRFVLAQPYIASRQISLPANGRHTENCLSHCEKITLNDAHKLDDIADTLADAIDIGLRNPIVYREAPVNKSDIVHRMSQYNRQVSAAKAMSHYQQRTVWPK